MTVEIPAMALSLTVLASFLLGAASALAAGQGPRWKP